MEGWFLEALIELGNWEEVRRYWVQVGYPFQNWLHGIFVQISVPLRLLNFIWILLSAVFQYKILIRFTPLTEKQSLLLTIFALVWPFYHLSVWTVFCSGIDLLAIVLRRMVLLSLHERKEEPSPAVPSRSDPHFFSTHLPGFFDSSPGVSVDLRSELMGILHTIPIRRTQNTVDRLPETKLGSGAYALYLLHT